MPHVLLLDSTTFHRRYRGRSNPAFSVLCAYGYDEGSDSGRLLRVAAYRNATQLTWADFLSEMPGMPEVVVSDGGQDVLGGIAARWPSPGVGQRPERVRCRWHLAQNLREALTQDLKPHLKDAGLKEPREHRLWDLAERAFDDLPRYELYERWARNSLYSWTPDSLDMPAAVKWLATNDLLVRSQLLRRAEGRPGPESTGPLEAHIKWLRHRLAYRAQSLRNAPRTNQLLRLMVAGRNGQADERAWAERIRQHLIANDGQAPRQRQLVGAGGL
jgi:hypothetical protein